MTVTITAYRDGRFTTEPQPDWWESGLDRAFDDFAQEQSYFGRDEGGNEVSVVMLHSGCGRVVTFTTTHGGAMVDVWIATDADFLDLLTTRVPAYIGLTQGRSVAGSINALCNAIIAFARHGQGEHIDRADGRSDIDARQDHAYERRMADIQASGKAAS